MFKNLLQVLNLILKDGYQNGKEKAIISKEKKEVTKNKVLLMQVWNKRMYLMQETVRVLNKLQNKQKKEDERYIYDHLYKNKILIKS